MPRCLPPTRRFASSRAAWPLRQRTDDVERLQVKMGVQLCSATPELNPDLTSGNSEVTCVVPSLEAGRYDFDATVTGAYGRAWMPPQLMQVSPLDGAAYAYLHHPRIDSLSHSSGGVRGGSVLVLRGSGFSSLAANNTVLVDGVACAVTAATSTELECVLGAGTQRTVSASSRFPGGRGLLWEVSGCALC